MLRTVTDNNRNSFIFLEIQLPFLSGYDFKLTFHDAECENMRIVMLGLVSSVVVLKKHKRHFPVFTSVILAWYYESNPNVVF